MVLYEGFKASVGMSLRVPPKIPLHHLSHKLFLFNLQSQQTSPAKDGANGKKLVNEIPVGSSSNEGG
jgi:hypothetical protein